MKFSQIYYQVFYKFKIKRNLEFYSKDIQEIKFNKLSFIQFNTPNYLKDNYTFEFLNLEKRFKDSIDWNFMEYGKLWNYNLQYLNFLNQTNLVTRKKVDILLDINKKLIEGELQLEPYPTSLRIINSIRFIANSLNELNESDLIAINKSIYSQTNYLFNNLEYHILGNHLLENAFALLISSKYFANEAWRKKAEFILVNELNEQILNDGAHFELSPMYHQIILARLLESISILEESEIKNFLKIKAGSMLAWLELMTFKNGEIAHFNDSSNNITLSTEELSLCAEKLLIEANKINQFSDSGYRKFAINNMEIVVDVNGIQPSYQPGHAHSDHLSFVLYVKGIPFIVDPGTSTYNINERRHWERSSKAHNTITIDNHNQSQVWGGFRVAKRAVIQSFKEGIDFVETQIKYKIKHTNVYQTRKINIESDNIFIEDEINTTDSSNIVSRYYLHPSIKSIEINNNEVVLNNNLKLTFINSININISDYQFALTFNSLVNAKLIEVQLLKSLKLEISTL